MYSERLVKLSDIGSYAFLRYLVRLYVMIMPALLDINLTGDLLASSSRSLVAWEMGHMFVP